VQETIATSLQRRLCVYDERLATLNQVVNNLPAAFHDTSKFREKMATSNIRLDTSLQVYGRKQYSQNDEDGVIEYLNTKLGIKNGYFVEFGVGPAGDCTIEESGLECNCRLLLQNGWRGLFMDGNIYPAEFCVQNERITALNIDRLLKKYHVPLEPDLMSIDVDGQDFWIWMATSYRPRIVIIEYNPSLHIDESCVMPFDISYIWDGTQYYGASLLALHKLGESKGYTLVYANGVNAFFVRTDLISNATEFNYESVYNYRGRLLYHRADHLNRAYLRV